MQHLGVVWPHSENLGNCSPYFTALQYINNLETQRSPKTTLDLENTILKKNLLSGLKIIRLFVKVERNVYKSHPLTRAPRYMLIKLFVLAIGWSYLHDLSHRFLTGLKLLYYVKWHVKSASFYS